jgi:hypothetical protein
MPIPHISLPSFTEPKTPLHGSFLGNPALCHYTGRDRNAGYPAPLAQVNSIGVPEDVISDLNGWSACAPVNASLDASRRPKQHSEPIWRVRPSSYGSFIHYSLPVLTGALTIQSCWAETAIPIMALPGVKFRVSREGNLHIQGAGDCFAPLAKTSQEIPTYDWRVTFIL